MDEVLNEEKIKELVTRKLIEGELKFDDFTKVVGIEKAEEVKKAKEVLEESIESAKEESAL